MGIPARIIHTGSLLAESTSETWGFSGGPVSTSFHATYAAQKQAQEDVAGATMGSPLTVPLENVVKVRIGIFTATGGSGILILTSAAGVNQAVPLSVGGVFMFHNPHAGDEITSIKLAGTLTVQYFIAGDAT
jgi:hypothetical protein